MLLRTAPAKERERYSRMIVDGQVDEMTELLKTVVTGAPLSESINAGQELIREAQGELAVLAPGSHADSMMQLGDALRELLEQLRD
jgi:hypothetical protein